MNPIEMYFENLHRSALLIKKQQPFFDWLLHYDAEMKIDEEVKEGEVYLLPDFETIKQMESWLKKNFDQIFSDQLNGWYTDEGMWPQHRTFKIFQEWFSYSLHTMIWDTQSGDITKN